MLLIYVLWMKWKMNCLQKCITSVQLMLNKTRRRLHLILLYYHKKKTFFFFPLFHSRSLALSFLFFSFLFFFFTFYTCFLVYNNMSQRVTSSPSSSFNQLPSGSRSPRSPHSPRFQKSFKVDGNKKVAETT
jgi:Ca2+-dependent lipid-binding protein